MTDSVHSQWTALPRRLQRVVGTSFRIGGIELYDVAPHHISAFLFKKKHIEKRRNPLKTDICGLTHARLVLNTSIRPGCCPTLVWKGMTCDSSSHIAQILPIAPFSYAGAQKNAQLLATARKRVTFNPFWSPYCHYATALSRPRSLDSHITNSAFSLDGLDLSLPSDWLALSAQRFMKDLVFSFTLFTSE